jgi:hypothetical protein
LTTEIEPITGKTAYNKLKIKGKQTYMITDKYPTIPQWWLHGIQIFLLKLLILGIELIIGLIMSLNEALSVLNTDIQVSQEEGSVLWEVIISINLSKKSVYLHLPYSERFPRYSSFTVHYTDEQHATPAVSTINTGISTW